MQGQKLVVVPEKYVREASEHFGEDSNSFARLLVAADQYKEAEMTPMFLYDPFTKLMYCVAEETYLKKLN